MRDIIQFIEKLKATRRFATLDEAATRQGIVLPLLLELGWDCFNVNEVCPEFALDDGRVDYALRIKNANRVFVEVKRPSEDLERHQDQLLHYSFKEGVSQAVLTNGVGWWFYLPLKEGGWDQRKFYSIDIATQEPKEVGENFQNFLSKAMVETGQAVQNAEAVFTDQKKRRVIGESLPKAWNKIVSEADESLVDLIAEYAERICGYKADAPLVEQFLNENRDRFSVRCEPQMSSVQKPSAAPRTLSPSHPGLYTGKTIESFEFEGRDYRVGAWIDMLLDLCGLLAKKHGPEFDRVRSLVGRKRPYFSADPLDLRLPRKLSQSEIYAESNLSANSVVRLCHDVLSLFGHSSSDLMIKCR